MKRTAAIVLTLLCLAASVPAVAGADSPQQPVAEMPVADIEITPRSGGVDITVADGAQHRLTVFAITGQVVRQMQIGPGTTAVDLAPGCYIVRVDRLSRRINIH